MAFGRYCTYGTMWSTTVHRWIRSHSPVHIHTCVSLDLILLSVHHFVWKNRSKSHHRTSRMIHRRRMCFSRGNKQLISHVTLRSTIIAGCFGVQLLRACCSRHSGFDLPNASTKSTVSCYTGSIVIRIKTVLYRSRQVNRFSR